ncbi:hypothetical protein D3C77_464740 [compost metagenome]
MLHRRLGHRHDIEICGRIVLKARYAHQCVAEQLIEPGPALLRRSEGLPALDTAEQIHKHMPIDLMDRLFANVGLYVFRKNAQDLRQRALSPFFETKPTKGNPLLKDSIEGLITGKAHGYTLLLALFTGIVSLSYERSCLLSTLPRVTHSYLRVTAEGHALLPALPVVAEMPDLTALGSDIEEQAVTVCERVLLGGDSTMPNRHFRECHGDLLNLSGAKC